MRLYSLLAAVAYTVILKVIKAYIARITYVDGDYSRFVLPFRRDPRNAITATLRESHMSPKTSTYVLIAENDYVSGIEPAVVSPTEHRLGS